MLQTYNNTSLSRFMAEKLQRQVERFAGFREYPPIIMEVCGTHTQAVSRFGIRNLLGDYLELRSGPGCPVCVTDQHDIDLVLQLCDHPGVIIATFGDMLCVPGSFTTLEKERSRAGTVRLVHSPMEAVEIARENAQKEIVFWGIGFETTAPLVALSVEKAKRDDIRNFSIVSQLKRVSPAMRALFADPDVKVDGFILPGHVCVVTGRIEFEFITRQYGKPAVVAGFEAVDILGALLSLLDMLQTKNNRVLNLYNRLVKEGGNNLAQQKIQQYFETVDACWRGFGMIKDSGLQLHPRYKSYNAVERFGLEMNERIPEKLCYCGELLKGKIRPDACPAWRVFCTPVTPQGPCMVSREGACRIFYYQSG